jgi:hypothetical protein
METSATTKPDRKVPPVERLIPIASNITAQVRTITTRTR